MKSLEGYQKLNYKMEIEFNPEEKAYFVNFPELPGCMADGKTPNEAVKEAIKVKNKWLEIALKSGWSVPEPQPKPDTSGRLTLRLPKYLHKKLIERAEQEGVSQNQLMVVYVSEGLERKTAEDTFKRLEERIKSGLIQREYPVANSYLCGPRDGVVFSADATFLPSGGYWCHQDMSPQNVTTKVKAIETAQESL